MTIEILASTIELTPAIRSYVEDKIGSLGKFVERFEEQGPLRISIEVARTTKHHRHGDVFYAEATLGISGKIIRAECTDADLYAAIDGMRDVLKQEISKFKGRADASKSARTSFKKI